MTDPARQPHPEPKEYTINDFDLYDFVRLNSWIEREKKADIIRASHSSTPAPVADVKELFRKEIAKWKDEDPLFMAYVYGQEAGRIEGAKAERVRVLDDLMSKFDEMNDERFFDYMQSLREQEEQRTGGGDR